MTKINSKAKHKYFYHEGMEVDDETGRLKSKRF